jgi:hypothetical protein
MTWLETGTDYVRQGIHEINTVTEYETLIDQGIDAYSALVEKEAQQAAEELKSGGGDQASEGSGSDQSWRRRPDDRKCRPGGLTAGTQIRRFNDRRSERE